MPDEMGYRTQTVRGPPGRVCKGAIGDESPPAWSMLDGTAAMGGGQPDSATSSVRLEVRDRLSAWTACRMSMR